MTFNSISSMQAFTSQAGDRLLQTPCKHSNVFKQPFSQSLPFSRCPANCSRHSRALGISAQSSSRQFPFCAVQPAAALQAGCQQLSSSRNSSCLHPQRLLNSSWSNSNAAGFRSEGSRSRSALQAVGTLVKSAPTTPTAPEEKLWIPFKVGRLCTCARC